ncbi:MAG TPA: hypothetical protein VGY56_21715 [Verrucomicrobiae bacterium]|nr:hypothetical protein [Verrucomicrobiae bacterium]
MSFMDLDATSNKATGQKDLSPKNLMWRSSNMHSFLSGCKRKWRHACDQKQYPGSLGDWEILIQTLGRKPPS